MTFYETLFSLAVVFSLIGVYQAIGRLLKLLDGHLERFQAKVDVMMAAQSDRDDKIDLILRKLL